MSKVYLFPGGGQKVRQLVELGQELTYEIDHDSDFPEKAGVAGCDSFTNTIWHTDFDSFKSMIEEWAGEEVELENVEEYNSKQEEESDRRSMLIDFLNDHQAISVSGFAKECGISHSLLKFIISGDRNITDSAWRSIESAMYKYGYSR